MSRYFGALSSYKLLWELSIRDVRWSNERINYRWYLEWRKAKTPTHESDWLFVIEEELEERLIILHLIAVKPLRAPTIRSINARRSGINEGLGHIWLSQLSLPDIAFLWTTTTSTTMEQKSAETTFSKKVSSNRLDEFWNIMNTDYIFRLMSGLRRLEGSI